MKEVEDERAIRELIETCMIATKEGDIATVLALMTDDVVFMVPGAEPFGKKLFASMSEKMKDVVYDGASDIREIKILGDWAYVRNYLKVKTTIPGKKPIFRSGWALTILRKENGKWKLARDANLLTVRK